MQLLLFSHFGAESSGPAALGLSLQAFLIQLVTFLVVFLVLKKWAFGPIIRTLNERRTLIESGVTLGEKMRAAEAESDAKIAQKLHQARQQADAVIAEAEAEARQRVQSAEADAQKRAEGIIHEADARIKQASERERKRLEQEVIGLVSEVSQAVIGEKVDPKKDAGLIERALKGRAS